MSASAAPPVVRLRIACHDEAEYRRDYVARFAAEGVFISSERTRAVGSHVHLKVELLDNTLAYSGKAVVVGTKADKRPGYLLRLVELALPSAPTPAPGPAGARRITTPLADLLFSDQPPPPDLRAGTAPLEVRTRAVGLRLRGTPARSPGAPGPGWPTGASRVAEEPQDWSDFEDPSVRKAPERPPPDPPLAEVFELPIDPTPPPVALAAKTAASSPGAMAHCEPDPAVEEPRPSRGRARLVLLAGAGVALLAVGAAALAVGSRAARRDATVEASFAAEIRAADDRLADGDLAGPRPGSALDHLVAARALLPDDARVTRRLQLLARKFEELGAHALARSDETEARVHYEAALRASPESATARQKLEEIHSRPAAPPTPRGAPP